MVWRLRVGAGWGGVVAAWVWERGWRRPVGGTVGGRVGLKVTRSWGRLEGMGSGRGGSGGSRGVGVGVGSGLVDRSRRMGRVLIRKPIMVVSSGRLRLALKVPTTMSCWPL